MGNSRRNLSGKVFGNLTAKEPLEALKSGVLWSFDCSCGESVNYLGHLVSSGKRWRCRECYLKALRKGRSPQKSRAKPRVQRPESAKVLHKATYSSWSSMRRRVSPNSRFYYRNYAGRGITLEHKPWEKFENFLSDMGDRPDGMSLERIDNSKGYSPGNCKWATMKEQVSNTRVAHRLTVSGVLLTATEAAALIGVSVTAVCNRIKKFGSEHTVAWVESKLGGKHES